MPLLTWPADPTESDHMNVNNDLKKKISLNFTGMIKKLNINVIAFNKQRCRSQIHGSDKLKV